MSVTRVVVASKNPAKVREIEQILTASGIEVVAGRDWPEVEETGDSLEENALIKARAVAIATGLPALADDTGLEVAALDGSPGVQTARFGGPAILVEVLKGSTDRRARFRTVVALVWPSGEEVVAEGSLEGTIAEAPRGNNGFGYDPVFEVEGRTLAELPAGEKHALSHRGRAVRALVDRLGV